MSDVNEWKKKLSANGLELRNAPNSIRADKQCCINAVLCNGRAYEYIDESLSKDENLLGMAMASFPGAYLLADTSLKDNLEHVLYFVENDTFAYEKLDEKFKSNDNVIQVALSKNPNIFLQLPYEKKHTVEMLSRVCKAPEFKYYYVMTNDAIRSNKDLVLQALSYDSDIFKFAPLSIRSDLEIAEKAISASGFNYVFASQEVQNNPALLSKLLDKFNTSQSHEVVKMRNLLQPIIGAVLKKTGADLINLLAYQDNALMMVKIASTNYEYLPDEFKFKSAIAKQAIEFKVWVQPKSGIGLELMQDGDFVEFAVRKGAIDVDAKSFNPFKIKFNSIGTDEEKQRNDKSALKLILLAALGKSNTFVNKLVGSEWVDDQDIITAAVSAPHMALALDRTTRYKGFMCASPALKANRFFIYELLSKQVNIFPYIDESLRGDIDIIKKGIDVDPQNFTHIKGQYVDENGCICDFDVATYLVERYGTALECCTDEIRNNITVAILAVQKDKRAIDYIGDDLAALVEKFESRDEKIENLQKEYYKNADANLNAKVMAQSKFQNDDDNWANKKSKI